MSRELIRNYDEELERLLDAIKNSLLDASEEEIDADIIAEGKEPEEVARHGREVLSGSLRDAKGKNRVESRLVQPGANESDRDLMKSRVASLLDFPRVVLEPLAVLRDSSEDDVDVRTISLVDVFGLSPEQLESTLPWCGRSVQIARTSTESDNRLVYSAYASEPFQKRARSSAPDRSLVITLKGSNGLQCTACLSATHMAALFEGDHLPADPKSITIDLLIQK